MKAGLMIPSRYLKKEDVEPKKLVTISALKEENVAPDNQPPENKWVMYFRESQKPLVLNNTNIQLLIQILGTDETDHWINQKVVLFNDPNVSFGGKIVGGIRVRKANLRPQQAPPPLVAAPVAATTAEDEEGEDSDDDSDIPF